METTESVPSKDLTSEVMEECEERLDHLETSTINDEKDQNDVNAKSDIEFHESTSAQVEPELIKKTNESIDSSKLKTIIERIDDEAEQ